MSERSSPDCRGSHGSPRVAVVGGGAIGTLMAASLSEAGNDTTLCVRTRVDELEIEDATGARSCSVRVASRPPGAAAPVPLLVLATKAHDTPSVRPWTDALAGRGTVVVVMQNGVDHRERVQPLCPDAAVLPALAYTNVERRAPGRIVHRAGDAIVVPVGPEADCFARLLHGSRLRVEAVDDFVTASWRKLLGNVAANPITALTMRRVEVIRESGLESLARRLMTEAMLAGRAEGAALTEADVDAAVRDLRAYPGESGTSMLFDRLAGLPLEHDLLLGAVVRAGRRSGVPVPLHEAMTSLLDAVSGRDPARI